MQKEGLILNSVVISEFKCSQDKKWITFERILVSTIGEEMMSRSYRFNMLSLLILLLTAYTSWANAAELLVLGDNQSHQSRGSALFLQSGFSDKFITEVTRRPPGQSLYGDSILQSVLVRQSKFARLTSW